jgi:hypothetical protein
MLVRVAGDADREVLDDLSGRSRDRRHHRGSGGPRYKRQKRALFRLFAALIQTHWRMGG